MPIITLTTDFGQSDGYVGIMKGVILGILPAAQLVDLSHEIEPQNVRQAAYVLAQATPYFPTGAVHLVVVDPGVGSARRPIAVKTTGAAFVGPDNGVLTPALDEPSARAWELNRPEYWLPAVESTFHGRDLFAPCAAHLARGVCPDELGSPISDPVRLALPSPTRFADGSVHGEVVAVDRFGNLITNIPGAWLAGEGARWRCRIAGREIAGLRRTYSDAAEGELMLLVSSGDTVEIAVRNGSAAGVLGVRAPRALEGGSPSAGGPAWGEPLRLWLVP
jgi:hypothetical protein